MLKSFSASPNEFSNIANHILNNTTLVAKDNRYRICEIEFYYFGEGYEDAYTHCSEEQKQNCKFYFHKYKTGTYKSGTYKCLDITISDGEIYFGILIRSIMNLETGEFIEEPCRSLTDILKQFDCKEVKEFCDGKKLPLKIYDDRYEFYLEDNNKKFNDKIFSGPRIGLSNKFPDYQLAKNRYAILIKNIKKQRKTFVEVPISKFKQ